MISALLRVPLYGALGAAWLWFAATFGRDAAGEGWWLPVLYGALGASGGLAIGVLDAARRAFGACEAALRARIGQAAGAAAERVGLPATMALAEFRSRYDRVVDRVVAESVGRVPLPEMARRWFRARIRKVMLGDFVAECERRQALMVGAGEVVGYLAGRGLAVAAAPVHRWFGLWGALIAGALALLGAVPLVARLLG